MGADKTDMPSSAHDPRRQVSRTPHAFHRDPFVLSRVLLMAGLMAAALVAFDRIIRAISGRLATDGSVASRFAGDPTRLLALHGTLLSGLLGVAICGLYGVLHFVHTQRRQLHDRRELGLQVGPRKSWRLIRDELALRTGVSAVALYAMFIGAQQLEAMSRGLHPSIVLTLTALPQFVTVGYALLMGLLVAAVGLIGSNTITQLAGLLARTRFRRAIQRIVRVLTGFPDDERIARVWHAAAIGSRGPPRVAVAWCATGRTLA
jgi:hypothetical protein